MPARSRPVALVSGATSTIGRTIAVGLAEDGHDLVLWGRDPDGLAGAAAAVRAVGGDARTRAFDLRDRAALDAAASDVGPLRVLVWAAGAFDWSAPDTAEPDAIEAVLDSVLVAAARTVRLVLPALLAAEHPASLVLLGSGADRNAFAGNASYVAAKHGLRGLADALHLDLRERGVRVTLVSPGLVAAGAGLGAPGALERRDELLQPEDVAAAVRFAVGFPGPGSVLHLDLEPRAALG
jgi:NADP-dependent 3-hydroxy acid dehydrogenase YdfG